MFCSQSVRVLAVLASSFQKHRYIEVGASCGPQPVVRNLCTGAGLKHVATASGDIVTQGSRRSTFTRKYWLVSLTKQRIVRDGDLEKSSKQMVTCRRHVSGRWEGLALCPQGGVLAPKALLLHAELCLARGPALRPLCRRYSVRVSGGSCKASPFP